MKKYILFLLIIGLLVGCKSANEPTLENEAKPIKLSSVQKARVGQDNDFAFDLLRNTIIKTKATEPNVFISPLSVSIAFGMVRNGANGETKTEIEKALRLSGLTDAEINDYYRIMQTELPSIDKKTKLSIANAIWLRSGFTAKPDYLKTNADYFKAYIKTVDFGQSWALDTINDWAKRNTNGLIPKVLNELDADLVALLMNAVYFKGTWVSRFNKESTKEADFKNEQGEYVKVNMMSCKSTFDYTKDDVAQYLDMPYGNKAFSMTVILPNENKTTDDVLKQLNTAQLAAILGKMQPTETNVFFPRFKVKNKFELIPMLDAMGIKKAFTPLADFSRMCNSSVFISFVKHDTYVEVTEEGTEAAAVTTIGFKNTSMPQENYFVANKPFLFLIREKSTGVILFIGKMGNVEKF